MTSVQPAPDLQDHYKLGDSTPMHAHCQKLVTFDTTHSKQSLKRRSLPSSGQIGTLAEMKKPQPGASQGRCTVNRYLSESTPMQHGDSRETRPPVAGVDFYGTSDPREVTSVARHRHRRTRHRRAPQRGQGPRWQRSRGPGQERPWSRRREGTYCPTAPSSRLLAQSLSAGCGSPRACGGGAGPCSPTRGPWRPVGRRGSPVRPRCRSGRTGQLAGSPARGSRMRADTKPEAAAFGLPGHTAAASGTASSRPPPRRVRERKRHHARVVTGDKRGNLRM